MAHIFTQFLQDEYCRPVESNDSAVKGWESGASEVVNVTKTTEDEEAIVYLTRTGKNIGLILKKLPQYL